LKRGIWSGQIASHSDRKEVSDTARLLGYVAAITQAGPADEDSPHRSHVAARHDPKRALVQSFVSDAGPPNRLQ